MGFRANLALALYGSESRPCNAFREGIIGLLFPEISGRWTKQHPVSNGSQHPFLLLCKTRRKQAHGTMGPRIAAHRPC